MYSIILLLACSIHICHGVRLRLPGFPVDCPPAGGVYKEEVENVISKGIAESISATVKPGVTWTQLMELWNAPKALQCTEDDINRYNALPDERKTLLMRGYDLQQYFRSSDIVSSFSSVNAIGIFWQTWIAVMFSLAAGSRICQPIPGDVKYPFIPRMEAVQLLLETKKKVNNSATIAMEGWNLISATPRMDDCLGGESFVDFFSHRSLDNPSTATSHLLRNPRNLLIDRMVTAAEGFFKSEQRADANRTLASNIADKKTSLAMKLLEIWEGMPEDMKQMPLMTFWFAHGTEKQVGDSVYQAGAWGMPIESNRYRRDSKASLLAAQDTAPKDLGSEHQFRVRPWSADEMLSEKTAFGANGMGAFRLMTEEQIRTWNGIYDDMLRIINDLPNYLSEDKFEQAPSWKWTASGAAAMNGNSGEDEACLVDGSPVSDEFMQRIVSSGQDLDQTREEMRKSRMWVYDKRTLEDLRKVQIMVENCT